MSFRNVSSLLLVAALAAAAAAACSTTVTQGMPTGGTAGGSGATGSTGSTGHGGASTTGSTGHGGTSTTGSTGQGGASTTGSTGHGGASTTGSTGQGGASTTGSTGQGGASTTGTGGAPAVDCSVCLTAGGQCSGGTCTITDNPGNVSTGDQTLLMGGGSSDPSFAWLYPYDKTVFPQGLTPPTLQFGGTAPTAFYVHVSFPGMDYKGFYAANSVQGFAILPADWTAITQSAGPTTAVKVEVTKIAGAQVSGPITETWTIAQGSLRGTIYYETNGSPMLGGTSAIGIMAIQPGAAAPTALESGCGNVCHSASADGSTLVANAGSLFNYLTSASYDLRSSVSTVYSASNQIFTYGGLYPDGSFVVTATGYRTFLGAAPGLYGTKTGAHIDAAGFDGVISSTGTPTFSPDGTMLAFNASGTLMGGGGSTLSVLSFAPPTFSFSNERNVAAHAGLTVAWPAFTPDGKWIVYQAGSSVQYETDNGASGDLYFTSSTTNAQARLDALDGYGNGKVYLPANDAGLSFAPSVLPEAVGGYFWVVFTSHRSYGNTLASMAAGLNGADTAGKLWVAAFDIDAAAGTDPSHPAFYLDGQELQANDSRGQWVPDPCQANGASCASGDTCCGGFCRPGDGGTDQCTDTIAACANLYERCAASSDCCLSGAMCINGRCAQGAPN